MPSAVCRKLNNGVLMPALSLGTYRLNETNAEAVIRAAVSAGYRGFDCAEFYKNEELLGPIFEDIERHGCTDDTIKPAPIDPAHIPFGFELIDDFNKSADEPVTGDRVFVTTKVWPSDYDKNIRECVLRSLKRLRRTTIDLLLMHWPGPHKNFAGCTEAMQRDAETNSRQRLNVWKQFEEIYRDGLVRAIGVSNFMPHHLAPLVADIVSRQANDPKATMIMCNQVEGSPWIPSFKLIEELCQAHNIAVACYRPLGGDSVKYGRIAELDVASEIGAKYDKSKANVLIRWLLQKGMLVLPKSATPSRVISNADVFSFELTSGEVSILDDLRVSDANLNENPNDIA